MANFWRIFGDFWVLYFQRAACSTFQTCILNSHSGHTMCESMVDIQSATTEVRRGKEEEEEERRNHRAINNYNGLLHRAAIIISDCYSILKTDLRLTQRHVITKCLFWTAMQRLNSAAWIGTGGARLPDPVLWSLLYTSSGHL